MPIQYVRPHLYPAQLAFVDSKARYTICEASTKVGKTVGCLVWITEQAMAGGPGQNYWWVAPIYAQAKIAYRRLKDFLPREVYRCNESELTITLANGAVIWFKSGEKPDGLYGEDVYAAVIDEASRCRQEAWFAIRTTLTATRGPVKIIGNVKGRRNWAWDLGQIAKQGVPDFSYFKLTAYDAVDGGILSLQEVEDAKGVLPDHVFRQDFLAEPADDGGNPFGLDRIRACIAPMSTAEPVVWGWDLAKSQDWTVGIALDAQGHVCRLERWQAPWRATRADILAMTRTLPALVDSTGVGDPILEDLQAQGPNYEGFKFSSHSKQQLMEGLALAIHNQELGFPEGVLVTELEAFEYQYRPGGRVTYSAPEGMHDDCVMALALALRASRGRLFQPVGIYAATESEPEVESGWFSFR